MKKDRLTLHRPALPGVTTRFSADGGVAIAKAPPGGRAHAVARPGRVTVGWPTDTLDLGTRRPALNAQDLGDQIRAQVQQSIQQRMGAAPAMPQSPAGDRPRRRVATELPPAAAPTAPPQAPASPRPAAPAPAMQTAPPAEPPAAPPETQVPAQPTAEPPQAIAPTDAPAATEDTAQLLGAMSAEDIESVLVQRGSKLAGQGMGEYILQMEHKYGVPAAQFLAQAAMESQIGSDDGYAQPGFNIGNIRPGSSWTGGVVDGPYGQFRVYNTREEGIEDYFRLLATDLYAGKPLWKQVETYAPPSDGNNTQHYYDTVCQLIDEWTGIAMPSHTY